MTINITHLKAFHAVASEGGFSKAARALRVSQPTLSQQVRGLEDRYRVRLLERRGQGVETTEFGDELLALTAQIFSGVDAAEKILQGGRDTVTGHLRLGAVGPQKVVQLMSAFRERYPDPNLNLMTTGNPDLYRALRDREVDIAIVAELPDENEFHAIVVTDEPVVAMAANGHPFSKNKQTTLKELAGQPLVLRDSGMMIRRIVEGALDDAGLRISNYMEADGWHTHHEMVAAGLGVAILTTADAGDDPRFTKIPITDIALSNPDWMICLKSRIRMPIVRAFFDIAAEVVAERRDAINT